MFCSLQRRRYAGASAAGVVAGLLLGLLAPPAAWAVPARTQPDSATGPTATQPGSRVVDPTPQAASFERDSVAERVLRARQLFEGGKYADAAALLQQVISVEPKPVHIFNLGQSQRRAGQIDEARASYQRFIDLVPQHPSVPEARNYIRELDLIKAQVQQAEQGYRLQLDRTRSDLLRQLNQTRDELLSERAQTAALRDGKPVYKRAWFWGVLGGTLSVAIVASAVIGYVATRAPDPPPTDTGYIGFTF